VLPGTAHSRDALCILGKKQHTGSKGMNCIIVLRGIFTNDYLTINQNGHIIEFSIARIP